MYFIKRVAAIIWKDVRAEFRTREMLSAMFVFSLLVVVIFGLAFDPSRGELERMFPGVLWIAFFFAGILGLNQSFLREKAGESLQGLMLAPVDRSAIFLGKMLGNLMFMLLVEAVSLPLFFVFFRYSYAGSYFWLGVTLIAGTFGFVSVGTFLAALAANTRASQVLLPLLLFPVVVPVVLATVQVTAGLFALQPPGELSTWLKVLLVYDLVFLVIPALLFEYLLEA